MADIKISGLTASTTYTPASTYVIVVDESDSTQAVTGSNYKVAIDALLDVDNSLLTHTSEVSDYTVLDTDCIVSVTMSAATTVTLPNAANLTAGKKFIIKDAGGNASVNDLIIDTAGGNIDGNASVTLDVNYSALTVYTDGTNYFII